MNVRRGEVVLVDFPYPGGTGGKARPALVVQNDHDNARLLNTVVVQITGTTHRALEATQVLIELSVAGKRSGLAFDSVVNCVNILTLERGRIRRRLGALPELMMHRVNEALKAAMELP
jgi:mRNA interferase MazF